MKKLLFASATALSLIAAPVMAQVESEAPLGSTNSVADKRSDFTTDQQAIYDSLDPNYRAIFDAWAGERQVLYFGWDAALRDYYWTLEPEQQEAWWYLTREQQIEMFQLQGAESELAWSTVIDQVAAMERAEATATTTSDEPQVIFASNAIVQSAPMFNGEYPVCQSDGDDHCINAWATGERGAGVDRPLDYWPGESVTESRKGG